MRDLDVIKGACVQALDSANTNNHANNHIQFHQIADPETVLELVKLLEESITAHELESMMKLINNLVTCLEAVPNDNNNQSLPDRDDQIRQAKSMLAIYAR